MDGIEADAGEQQSIEAGKRIRRLWTERQKRQMVREAQKRGAVRQEVARRHGVHVSVLNRWCTEHRTRASGAKNAMKTARLVPVRVRRARASRTPSRQVAATIAASSKLEAIEVDFSNGRRVCVRGAVDAGILRTVLQELSQ